MYLQIQAKVTLGSEGVCEEGHSFTTTMVYFTMYICVHSTSNNEIYCCNVSYIIQESFFQDTDSLQNHGIVSLCFNINLYMYVHTVAAKIKCMKD